MIPNFTPNGLLPKGIHEASWEEFCQRFGLTSVKRKQLIKNLTGVIIILQQAECHTLYIDGSFVTAKERPGDFDVCWSKEGVDLRLLNQIAPILKNAPKTFLGINCKKKYGGDVFTADRLLPNPNASEDVTIPDTISFLEFFQMDKETLLPKGIIVIDLTKINLSHDKEQETV